MGQRNGVLLKEVAAFQVHFLYVVKPLLKDTSEMPPPPLTEHHCSVPFDIPYTDMCAYKTSEISIPQLTRQLTVVPMVSIL